MNQLEIFWTRKKEVLALLKAANVPYKKDKEAMSQTASSWAQSNLSLEEIEDLIMNIPVDGDNKNNRNKDELDFFKQASTRPIKREIYNVYRVKQDGQEYIYYHERLLSKNDLGDVIDHNSVISKEATNES